MATDEARARTAPGRQPPERVRSKHDVSSLACDTRSGREFGLLVVAWRELLGPRREVWARVWVVGRQSAEGQTPARHEPHGRPRCNRVGLRPVGGTPVLLYGDECHISMPCRAGYGSGPVWTLVTPE
jgi:hypothetical protein